MTKMRGIRVGILLRPQDQKLMLDLQRLTATRLGQPGPTEIIRQALLAKWESLQPQESTAGGE